MAKDIVVSIIGLDTSHAVEFPRVMQSPDCSPEYRVTGMRVARCLRFSTPFQSEEGLDKRQKQLEAWGVKVTRDFEEAVSGCDAIMLEINDPGFHLEYFKRCAGLGKPVFLDKPLADTIANGRQIARLASEKGTRFFSSSSLRFTRWFKNACAAVPSPALVSVYGPLGKAPAGSSIVWYGVHAFEMLQRAIGRGAVRVTCRGDSLGAVAHVEYPDARRGVVELTENSGLYGGCLRDRERAHPYIADLSGLSTELMMEVRAFFLGAAPPLQVEDTLEVMALLDAAERSFRGGKPEDLQ